MKATGIVRRIDPLGRIVIPMELRKMLGMEDNAPIEIFTDENQGIVLRKYSPEPDYIDRLKAILADLDPDKARTAAALLERAIAELEESE